VKLTDIIRYAERQTRSVLNIDAIHPGFYAAEALKLPPELHIHRGSFCEFAKRHSAGAMACSANKHRSQRVASRGRPFSGACMHGMWELAWPVMHEGEHMCTIYLGHYRTPATPAVIGGARFKGLYPPEITPETRRKIYKFGRFIAGFIRYELAMWLAQGNTLNKHKPAAFYYDFCTQFIECNYQKNIQLQDLARTLHVSRNYLSTRIRRETGRRFTQLLTKKRMEVAGGCLEFMKNKSVSDIAYLCGFQDSNYFSTVFRRYYGESPLAFRKKKAHEFKGRTALSLL
jgi:AraC-like DNA-binding protein